jgi:hypothetical protein
MFPGSFRPVSSVALPTRVLSQKYLDTKIWID